MTTTPPGWYDDGHGALRWWDGAGWTDRVAQPDSAMNSEPVPPQPAPAAPPVPVPGPVPPTGDTPGAAPVASTGPAAAPASAPPTKSKLWIVWVVLGVVVLGIVIGTIVLISLLLIGASAKGGTSGGSGLPDEDQDAAVATVELYDDAWNNADCDAYLASTSEAFRTQSGLTDCSAFESEAEAFDGAVEDYTVTITDVQQDGDEILVTTTETYTALLDDDGEPLDEPTEESVEWVYTLVSESFEWVIDDMQ